jgi:hypothetical protein
MQWDPSAFVVGTLKAIVAGSLIGGGTIVLQNSRENAVQTEQIIQLQDNQKIVINKMDSLKGSLDKANENVSTLNGYMQGVKDGYKEK